MYIYIFTFNGKIKKKSFPVKLERLETILLLLKDTKD